MSFRINIVAILLAGFLLPLAGCRHAVRRAETPVVVLVSGPLDFELLPRIAGLAAAAREQGEAVWLVAGPVGADGVVGCLTEGRGILRVLDAAGVDAVFFGPEWLEFGAGPAARLVSSADMQMLSCNIADSVGEPLAHPMLLKRLKGITVGFTAAWTDMDEPRLRVRNSSLLPVDRATGRVLGLMRMHCDIAGLVLLPGMMMPGSGYDFVVGPSAGAPVSVPVPDDPGRVTRLELQLAGGRVADYQVVDNPVLDRPEQPEARRVVDSVQAEVNSILARPVVPAMARTGPEALTRMVQDEFLARGFDGFLTDRPLFDRALGPGMVDVRAVREAMPEPGRPGLVELTGGMVAELLGQDGVELRWGQAFRNRQLVMAQSYRLVALPGFLARHPKAALNGYEVINEPVWRIAAQALAGEQD